MNAGKPHGLPKGRLPDGQAARLRAMRTQAGLPGKDLAAILGWSPSKVSRIENERQPPSAADVEAWICACRVPADTTKDPQAQGKPSDERPLPTSFFQTLAYIVRAGHENRDFKPLYVLLAWAGAIAVAGVAVAYVLGAAFTHTRLTIGSLNAPPWAATGAVGGGIATMTLVVRGVRKAVRGRTSRRQESAKQTQAALQQLRRARRQRTQLRATPKHQDPVSSGASDGGVREESGDNATGGHDGDLEDSA